MILVTCTEGDKVKKVIEFTNTGKVAANHQTSLWKLRLYHSNV
jgi:hypothetical protein